MVKVIPAILANNLNEWEEKFNKVKGLTEMVQLDVVDGVFTKNKTIFPQDLVGQAFGGTKLDVQLMVNEPIEWLEQCVSIGTDRVFGHVEMMEDQVLFVAEAQVKGFGVGLALDLDTPVSKISSVIDDLDAVLLMSVKAGETGQEFVERVLPKIEEVRALRNDLIICIDGGLDIREMKACVSAEWAEEIKEGDLHKNLLDIEFAVGTHLLNAANIEEKLKKMEYLED
jgi:ribulose-phosphate 3-epimerase